MQFDIKNFKEFFFRYIVGSGALAMLFMMGVYAGMGIYARHLADDYCEAARVSEASSPLNAVIERYQEGGWRAADRYSNLLFVGFSEMLGKYNMQVTICAMIVLWTIGLIWGMTELRKLFNIHWPVSMDWFFGLMLGSFSLLQAANLYQTIYWRSSMMTHFAPLVFGTFLFAFLLGQIRRALTQKISWMVYPALFLVTFIISGFSEPPATTMVTGLSLTLLFTMMYQGQSPSKKRNLLLLAWTFAGALSGLLVMFFSPAGANNPEDVPRGLMEILINSFSYAVTFFVDSIRVFPVPILVSLLISFLLMWLYAQAVGLEISTAQKRLVWLLMIAAPILMWILIAAGFAPSVYGQNYPAARMRLLARILMTAMIMLEGASLGLLSQRIQLRSARGLMQQGLLILFMLVGFLYPLRAAIKNYQNNIQKYSSHAQIWDERDALIRSKVSAGELYLTVTQLDSMFGIEEYKEDGWVNICAARYYGLRNITAP